MTAIIIDGKALASKIKLTLAHEVQTLNQLGKAVHLNALLVGDTPAAKVYAQNQARTCAELGILYTLLELPVTVTQGELHAEISRLNADPDVTGIMMHMPLPEHLDTRAAQYMLDLKKDVEGVNPANIGHVVHGHTIIAPCTALAVVELIESTGIQLRGAEVTVVGASRIVGKPVALLLQDREATVRVCHIYTHDLSSHTRSADVLVVAVGKAGLIGPEQVKPGAVVIDVGINRVLAGHDSQGKPIRHTVGDVQFEAVSQVAGFITPVPGGVGPMTVAMLLKNTLRAARLVHGLVVV